MQRTKAVLLAGAMAAAVSLAGCRKEATSNLPLEIPELGFPGFLDLGGGAPDLQPTDGAVDGGG